MKKTFYLLLLVVSIITNGCGFTADEIGRVSIDQLSTEGNIQSKSITLDLKNGDKLSYWADMNIEFEGELALEFQVRLTFNEKQLGARSFNPFDRDITMGEVKSTLLNKTTWRFSGRMKHFTIPEDGKYTFEVILLSNGNETFKMNKADLVFKK